MSQLLSATELRRREIFTFPPVSATARRMVIAGAV